jgi:predicted site-specific integrase-resolvase
MQRPDRAEIVSTAEAAVILGVEVATINRWTLAGRLTVAFQGLGKTSPRFFYREDVEALRDKLLAERAGRVSS